MAFWNTSHNKSSAKDCSEKENKGDEKHYHKSMKNYRFDTQEIEFDDNEHKVGEYELL
jgi:hypothetical protein